MSKNETFFQKIEDYPFSLINQFLLFQYSSVYFHATLGIEPLLLCALEREWARDHSVQLLRIDLLYNRSKSPLNIETIEFC